MIILHKVLVLLLIICNCDNSNSMTTSSVINDREKRAQKAAQRDLVIVFDSTGSMGDDLAQLRAAAINIVEMFGKKKPNPISNYILVEFNDPWEGIVQKTHLKSIFLADLNRITVHGGGDCPEQCYAALEKAIAASSKGSFVFVFTDAYTHQANKKQAIRELIAKKQSQVFFFVAGFCRNKIFEHGEYSDIAIGSRGLFFATFRTAIGEIFEGISSLIEPTVSTGDVFTTDGKKIEKPLIVDGTVNIITLTISGQNPVIIILDPRGKEYTNYSTNANTTNAIIVRIDGPEPGTWIIVASADSPMSGLFSVSSSLMFEYGFSTDAPKSIYRTSSAPLTGSTNYLSISPSEDLLIGQLASVEMIWFGNEKKLLLTRTETNYKEVLYSTPAFDLPKSGFMFYLNGYDSGNNTLRRLITPKIYPTDGSEKPDMSEPLDRIEVQEGEPIELVCQVHSHTPITISWEKVGYPGILKQISTNSSDRLDYIIQYADSSDSGDYTCKSVNKVGQSSVNTFVDVRATPLTITTPDKLKHPIEGQDAILKCVSFPTKRVVHSWSVNASSILPSGFQLDGSNLVLKNVRREMSGTYTCTGTRGTETKSDTMTIDVYFPIKITSIILTTNGVPREIINIRDQIDIVNVTTLSIECKSEGNPKPSHGWRHNNVPVSSTTYYRIDPSEKSFSGKYDCFAYNDRSKALHQTNLNIIVKPSLQIGYNFAPLIVKGLPFKQNCPIQNKDADTIITWWTDKGTLLAFNVNANSEIETNAVEMNMHGKFYCLAENKAGVTRAEFEFDVLIPPRIVEFDKTDEVADENLLGKRMPLDIFNTSYVNFSRDGAGNPESFKNGSVIGNSCHVSFEIPVTEESSSGVCTCKSSNHLAAEQTEIELNVILLPRVTPGYNNTHNLTEHMPFRLDCPITGKIDAIIWLKDNYPIANNSIKNYSLSIESPLREMTGSWSCLAINKAGVVKAEFRFEVFYKPELVNVSWDLIEKYPGSNNTYKISLMKQSRFNVTCVAIGNPEPEISWFRNNQFLHNRTTLEITSVTRKSDLASYKCQALNIIGFSEAIFDLDIKENLLFNPSENFNYINGTNEPIRRIPGQFSEIDVLRFESEYLRADYVFKQDIKITEGQEHTLNCEMKEGYPYPKYAWFKNGELTETETAFMKIKSAMVNDTGLYKCIASNELNTISILFYLYVLDTPKVVTSKSITVEKGQDFKITCTSQGHFFTAMDWNYGEGGILQASNSFMFRNAIENQTIVDRIVDCIQNREPIYIVNEDQILFNNERLVKYNKYGVLKYSTQMGTTIGTLELHIKNATVQNAGEYRCTVAKNVSESLNVIVVEPPWSSKPAYEEREGIEGVKFVLSCEIRGKPPPTITWWKDDMPIDRKFLKDNNIAPKKNNPDLNFRSPNYHNSGNYSCVATNNYGTHKRQIRVEFPQVTFINLTKIDFEKLLNHYNSTPLTLQKGEPEILNCDAIPSNESVTWFEVRLKPYPVKMKISNARTISVELTERAMYLCTGPGDDDAKGMLYSIEVVSKPKIRAPFDIIGVFVGDYVNMMCPADGVPPPQNSWFRKTNNGSLIDLAFHKTNLVIERTKLSDAGKYLCVAKNVWGEDQHNYELQLDIKYINFNVGAWSPCSFKNGIGRQYRPTSCTRADTNEFIPDCPRKEQTRQCFY